LLPPIGAAVASPALRDKGLRGDCFEATREKRRWLERMI
jgi:hypothetical protein